MMQTLKYSSKTAQILARYRPIAPKPPDHELTQNIGNSDPSGMPENIRDSPSMRSVWPHLQARPTRTRKRGRSLLAPNLPSTKRSKPSYAFSPNHLSPKNLSSFLASPNVLLPNYTSVSSSNTQASVKDLELNMHVPVEKDLLKQLQAKELQVQVPSVVTVPRSTRLVSSAITVQPQSISNQKVVVVVQGPTKAKEIEEEVESEALPTVISDSKNKVRLANSAYNKLIGQPQCCWLDSIAGCGGDGCGGKAAVTCNKICGDVMLQLPDSAGEELVSSVNGFFCLVVIEWGTNEYKSSITTFAEAVRLFCESRDYMFAWRFHTQGPVTCAPDF